jgi:hypothetical protein
MAVSIQVEAESGTAIISCTGVLRLQDAMEDIVKLWEEAAWAGEAAVWDFREAQFDIASSEAREIARYIRQNQPEPPPRKVAWVTGREVDFGMARVFQAFREDDATHFRVFNDFDEALSWVKRPK